VDNVGKMGMCKQKCCENETEAEIGGKWKDTKEGWVRRIGRKSMTGD
jgi:hypothetical protein